MDQPTPETLRRNARRCHALARTLANAADCIALDDYADQLDQRACDMEIALPASASRLITNPCGERDGGA